MLRFAIKVILSYLCTFKVVSHNSKRCMHPDVHCITVYNSQHMEAGCTPTDGGVDKNMWHIQTVERYSVIREDGTRFAAAWMDL